MEDNNRLLEQRTNTALGQIAALAQRIDRLEAGPSDRPDPMETSLQILQDIATEIANLRESQARNTIPTRVHLAAIILAGQAANPGRVRASAQYAAEALEAADRLLELANG